MIILRLGLLFGLPWLMGSTLLGLIAPRESRAYLALPLGFGSLAFLMFFACRLGMPLTLINCVLLGLAASGIMLAIRRLTGWKPTIAPVLNLPDNFRGLGLKPIEIILLAALATIFGYVFTVSIIKPLVDVDAFQFYSIVAKGIFYKGSFLSSYLEPYLNDKPIFPYLYQGWSFLALGTPNDALFKIANPVLFVCYITAFYSVIRRFLSRAHSLLFALLLASLPLTLYHVSTAYADFPITLFYGLSCFYLFLFLREFDEQRNDSFSHLSLSLAFLSFTIWSKRAGLVLAILTLLVIVVFLVLRRRSVLEKKNLSVVLTSFWPLLVFALPWIITSQKGTLARVAASALGSDSAAIAAQQLATPNLNVMATIITNKLFFYGNWQLLMGLFVICLIFFWPVCRKPALNYLLTLILLCFFVIVYQFHTPEMYNWLLDGTLFDRLMMNLTPAIMLFCAACFAQYTKAIPAKKDNLSAVVKRVFAKRRPNSYNARVSRG